MARSTRTLKWSIALLLATALLGWLWIASDGPSARKPGGSRERTDEGPEEARRPGPLPPQAGGRAPARPSAPGPSAPPGACAPRASRECQSGDVYWLDACGQRGEKAEECGARLCKGEACEPTDELACAGLPLEGICDGDVVRGCLSGWLFERDCRALGKRCVIGDEGAVCRKSSEDDCEGAGPLPRCEGDKLIACMEGQRVVRDCAALDARCGVLPQTNTAACVATRELARAPRDQDPCGPCGCPDGEPPEFTEEQCNGTDDDGDEWIDEGVRCEPLEVMAYVITDATGASSYAREDLDRELETINSIFAGEGNGLRMRVELAGVTELALPEYVRVDDASFGGLLHEIASRTPAYAGLQIPIVFTDEIIAEDAPKAGLSTIPNGTCGGIRRTLAPQPARGLVVIAKRRAPTTVAHELGHYLGLCHTHESDAQTVVQTAHWRDGQGQGFNTTCDATCALQGDGICDTPYDPGPEGCNYDSQCSAHCTTGAAPSTHNLMSYYTECRDRLTPEQTIEIKRSRALLEGWSRCAEPGSCLCSPNGLQRELASMPCPEQMTCRPEARGLFACSLDGAFMEGEPCGAHVQCGSGLACLNGRCAPLPPEW